MTSLAASRRPAAKPGKPNEQDRAETANKEAQAMELINYTTNEVIRQATDAEAEASKEAARYDGGAGVIVLDDGPRAYVI